MKIKHPVLFIIGCFVLLPVLTPIPVPAPEKLFILALAILILQASISFSRREKIQRQPIILKDNYQAAIAAVALARKSVDKTAQLIISTRHLEIYKSYGGDIDGWLIMKRESERSMTGEIWSLIDVLVQDLIIIQNGNASASFEKTTMDRLKASCEDEEIAQQLIEFSKIKRERLTSKLPE